VAAEPPAGAARRRRPRRRPVGPARRPGRSEQLVVDRPGDPHPRVEPLHGPAGGHQLLVQEELLGGAEAVDDPVGHHPVAVVPVAGQQVDPALVADRAAVGQDQLTAPARRVGEVHLEGALDLDGSEVVDLWRPLEVAPQHGLERGRRPGQGPGRPGEPLEDQRQHHRPLPVPHPREVVDGEGVMDGQVQVGAESRLDRLEVLALPRPEIPLPATALERRPVRRREAVGHAGQRRSVHRRPEGTGPPRSPAWGDAGSPRSRRRSHHADGTQRVAGGPGGAR
jgi:hypothetical protein